MDKNKDRLLKIAVGLDYNGNIIPEYSDMKQNELISLINDYEDFVLSTHLISIKEFLKIRTVIYNAELHNYNIGDTVYFYDSRNGMIKSYITEKFLAEDGTITYMIEDYLYEVGAGELYKNPEKWII